MVKERNNKYSTVISLGLHIGVVALVALFGKPISVLVPSRSDGIEVSLVSMPQPTEVETYKPVVKAVPAPLKVMDTPADVNIKQDKPQPKPQPTQKPEVKPVPPVKQLPTPAPSPVPTKAPVKPINKKAQINDLLGDTISENTASIRKGKALGGNPNGTSDSNNLVSNYADQVINAVRPFVVIPDGTDNKAKAIVKVELYPNLNVKSVTLVKSSGNPMYDQSIQSAIMRVKVFPPLPDGANFVDYRILRLTFRPQ